MKFTQKLIWILATLLLTQSLVMPDYIQAADSKEQAVKKVKKDYDTYEKSAKDNYKKYADSEKASYQSLLKLVDNDYKHLKDIASDDYNKLKKKYDSRKLDSYYGEINRLGRSVDIYYGEIHRLGQSMDRYYGDIYRLAGALDRYYGDIYRLTETLDRYYGEVHRIGGTLHRFEQGKSSITQLNKDFAEIKSNTHNALTNRVQVTTQSIQERRASTIKSLCLAKRTAIENLNRERKEVTGETIDFGTFGIDSLCGQPIKVFIDGVEQDLSQEPVIIQGNTLVPLKQIFVALGADVSWNALDQSVSVTKGQRELWFQINNRDVRLNGKEKTVSVAPTIIQGTSMVPVSLVGEALEVNVQWDGQTRSVLISTK
ncbi:copper amine oxidase N-terminal domain-containing protein [Brevibacillus daliensis]|uniref:copper amine oxidase N-terminal domain-containing protein n=1 Tax=Brevibacillus daliensis TaxID=2892995 RepID=UPI001E6449D6|nr:copper amine oxidase N-terminal domain-containing protein [Brevibacillus daliensis]